MIYQIAFSKKSKQDIELLKKTGDKIALKKLDVLLSELRMHPKTGTGQPEQLKFGLVGCWSRRITRKHRIIYAISEEMVTVLILSSHGHYLDK